MTQKMQFGASSRVRVRPRISKSGIERKYHGYGHRLAGEFARKEVRYTFQHADAWASITRRVLEWPVPPAGGSSA
ncbi:MAG TPA: hypothetical protein VL242_38205, partial [Sorangium sp.]|nr:hypothetical protein [Sorangium sp.]